MEKIETIAEYGCPHCPKKGGFSHWHDRLLSKEYELMKARGGTPAGERFFSQRKAMELTPAGGNIFSKTILMVYYDFCLDCGTEYAYQIDRITVPITYDKQHSLNLRG